VIRILFALGIVVQIFAIVHCVKRGRDRFWIWIILFGGAIGAAAYYLVEVLPEIGVGDVFTGPGRRKKISMLRAVIRDNPSAGNYEQLGELLVQEKKWHEAREAFDKALASRTDSLDPFYWRGVSAYETGDYLAAIPDLQHVVKVDPKYDYSRAMCRLACALARGGRTEDAAQTFERLVETTSSAESLVNAAEFYAVEGRYDKARELVYAILERRATMPSYQRRRDAAWLRKAKQLERKLRTAA
jgi:hypothetical protein